MTDISTILVRLDVERRHLARDGDVIDKLPSVTRLSAADGSHHTVIWSSLTPANAEAAIQQEIAAHAQLGVPFEWKVYSHDTPEDLRERLAQHGFHIGPCEAVLVTDLGWGDMLGDESVRGADPTGTRDRSAQFRVERVDCLEQIADFQRVAEAIFGKDYSFTAGQLADGIRNGSTQHRGYIAYSGDEPVSIGRLYTHPESWFGGLYGGGTLVSHRGKGYYRAVVAARAGEAAHAGARYLIVDALPTSRPILERLGFLRIAETWPCDWRPDAYGLIATALQSTVTRSADPDGH